LFSSQLKLAELVAQQQKTLEQQQYNIVLCAVSINYHKSHFRISHIDKVREKKKDLIPDNYRELYASCNFSSHHFRVVLFVRHRERRKKKRLVMPLMKCSTQCHALSREKEKIIDMLSYDEMSLITCIHTYIYIERERE
jgi:hypothetical protein